MPSTHGNAFPPQHRTHGDDGVGITRYSMPQFALTRYPGSRLCPTLNTIALAVGCWPPWPI
ncbi:protein of unknown function [Serratia sp. Tan611]|nr:protein of unknown function [Serratia sp. Tan611]